MTVKPGRREDDDDDECKCHGVSVKGKEEGVQSIRVVRVGSQPGISVPGSIFGMVKGHRERGTRPLCRAPSSSES